MCKLYINNKQYSFGFIMLFFDILRRCKKSRGVTNDVANGAGGLSTCFVL